MSSAMIENRQSYEQPSRGVLAAVERKQLSVLIPYDGSAGAETALDDLERAGLPRKFEALIAVMDVWLPSTPFEITRAVSARRLKLLTSGMSSFAPAMRDREEQRVLSREADDRIRSMFPSANVTTEVMQESASLTNDIVEKAQSYGADLIVLGSKASPSPDITDYAGPALSVARAAHCSVRIARTAERSTRSPIHILIGLDETKSIEGIVKVVAERAWPIGTKVDIVVTGELKPRDPARESLAALALQEIVAKLRATGSNVSIAFKYGEAQDLLLEHAKEMSADCIFMDADMLGHGQGIGGSKGLSRVAQSIVLGAPCSVEIVRPKTVTHEYLKPAA
jgi:nucleotide-binding universal stress UspA family protein